jgi:hypothetical protein
MMTLRYYIRKPKYPVMAVTDSKVITGLSGTEMIKGIKKNRLLLDGKIFDCAFNFSSKRLRCILLSCFSWIHGIGYKNTLTFIRK